MRNEIDPLSLPAGTEAWGYGRISPGDNQTIESQVAAIQKLCNEKGWNLTRMFTDRWKSGGTIDGRDGFEMMIHLAKKKPINEKKILIIYSYARFGRDQEDAPFFRAELRVHGWIIYSMTDKIPAGAMSLVFEALIDWKNSQFLHDLKMGTVRGLLYIADQGCIPGGQVCVGYRYEQKPIGVKKDGGARFGRKPIIDPDKAVLITKAFELKASGATNRSVSEATGLFSPYSGAWPSFFTNRAYIGEFLFSGQTFRNVYPAIISRELFEAVQRQLPAQKEVRYHRENHPRRKGSSFWIANISFCGYCKSPMEGKSVNGYRYYVCSKHNKNADLCPEATLIPADAIEEEILNTLLSKTLTSKHFQDLLTWTNKQLNSGLAEIELRLAAVAQELSDAESVGKRMTRNYFMMDHPTRLAEQMLKEQETKINQLQDEIMKLQQDRINSRIDVSPEQIAQYLASAKELIEASDYFDLRDLLEHVCSRIILRGDECRLEVMFPTIS